MNVHDSIAILIGLAACGFDLSRRRIPNALTLGAAAAAIFVSASTGGQVVVDPRHDIALHPAGQRGHPRTFTSGIGHYFVVLE